MMVLILLLRGLVANLHSLLGAKVYAGKALGAVLANPGLLLCNCDVAVGAHLSADATADAFVHIDVLLYRSGGYGEE